jgi:hypothetical protein
MSSRACDRWGASSCSRAPLSSTLLLLAPGSVTRWLLTGRRYHPTDELIEFVKNGGKDPSEGGGSSSGGGGGARGGRRQASDAKAAAAPDDDDATRKQQATEAV